MRKVVSKYLIFAIISTIVNLSFQSLSFFFYKGFLSLYVAIFFGTLSGLIVKYILDKNYIFYHKTKNKRDEGKKFFLYSFMGVFTTIIFWGFEIGFNLIFHSQIATYIGATLGLGIGYIIKYFLDKRFVFIN